MEGVRSPSAEIEDCYLKTIFPNMLPDKFLYFISDMGVTDPRYYDQQYRKLSLHLQEFSSTHIHGLAVYVKEGLPFARDLTLENSADSYFCF